MLAARAPQAKSENIRISFVGQFGFRLRGEDLYTPLEASWCPWKTTNVDHHRDGEQVGIQVSLEIRVRTDPPPPPRGRSVRPFVKFVDDKKEENVARTPLVEFPGSAHG